MLFASSSRRRPQHTEYIPLIKVSSPSPTSAAFDPGEREYAMPRSVGDEDASPRARDSKNEAEVVSNEGDASRDIFALAPDSALPEGTVDPVYERKAMVLNAAVSSFAPT